MTTSNNTLLNQVIGQLKEINEPTLMQAHNDYCQTLGYEDELFYNDEYEINSNFDSAFDALRNLQHYNLSDVYFYFHNGNLISFSYLTSEDSPITFSELAQWIIDNESYNDYNINVMTLDDIIDAILDNVNDIDSVHNIIRVLKYLDLDYVTLTEYTIDNDKTDDDYISMGIEYVSDVVKNSNYEQLKDIADFFNIEM